MVKLTDCFKFINKISGQNKAIKTAEENILKEERFRKDYDNSSNISLSEEERELLFKDKHIELLDEVTTIKEPINKLIEITNKTSDNIEDLAKSTLRTEKISEQNFKTSCNLSKIAILISIFSLIVSAVFSYLQYNIAQKQYELQLSTNNSILSNSIGNINTNSSSEVYLQSTVTRKRTMKHYKRK